MYCFRCQNENSVQLDLGDLSTLNLYSDSYNGLLSANNTDLKKLFLEKSFNETKIKAKEIISNIFNFYVNSVNITDDQKQRLATKIKENKEKLVFILSYLNRWFNFNINRWNFKNWLLFSNWFNTNKKVLILGYLIDFPSDFQQYLPH
ncbi:ZmpA/ZmpB/ZmpC family metallo-endopeptidase, partial [Mesomycoplasma hyorhinis]|uniref:ZmpA/ZmpB/ZmpC family metallo-endopeptidase n=1 Tax=Mesomycoplasma hyorhinis TaxID=2100 RepID=UPI00280BF5CB